MVRLEPGKCQYQHKRQEAHRRLVWLLIPGRSGAGDGGWRLAAPRGLDVEQAQVGSRAAWQG